jgi:Response regulator receiver domain
VTVLIVEDHFWTRYMAAEYFRGSGYRVIEANNADEAVSVLAAGSQVHVVFSDIRMPRSTDGLGRLDRAAISEAAGDPDLWSPSRCPARQLSVFLPQTLFIGGCRARDSWTHHVPSR